MYLDQAKYTKYPLKTKETITLETTYTKRFEAPLPANTEVGKITVKLGEEIIDEIPIKTTEQINKKGVVAYFFEIMKLLKFAI